MKKSVKICILLVSTIVVCFCSCKKCSNCNYTNAFGNKGPTFEVCGQEFENLKAQPDAEKYECVSL